MPNWAGTWLGGRYYLDVLGRHVYFIERRRRSVRLDVHEERAAEAELGRFLDNPQGYVPRRDEPKADTAPVHLTTERINRYLASIRDAVEDHRKARRKYLLDWSEQQLDLRAANLKRLRTVLASFEGGHRGRAEALNAFARWLVREGELPGPWRPVTWDGPADPEKSRAARQAYSLEQLRECYARLDGPVRDVFHVRAATGMHQTEIDQLEGAPEFTGPLPDKGAALRVLPAGHAIAGVLQVRHKSGHTHRVSVDLATLEAAQRLRGGVPNRVSVWKAMGLLVPSNLRHTFSTLAGECGELVTWSGEGVDRSRVAQVMGHRAGSTMLADRYERLQVPPMVRLPLGFE